MAHEFKFFKIPHGVVVKQPYFQISVTEHDRIEGVDRKPELVLEN